jgi:hypothetical protein
MNKLTLDEFLEVYRNAGEVGASLVINDVGIVNLDVLMEKEPECVKFFKHRIQSHHWATLLGVHPQYAPYCDWNIVDPDVMASLLYVQPQLAAHAHFDKFLVHNWCDLLRRAPQFTRNFRNLPKDCQQQMMNTSYDLVMILRTNSSYE